MFPKAGVLSILGASRDTVSSSQKSYFLSHAFSPCNHLQATWAEPLQLTAIYSPHSGNTRDHRVGQGGQGTTSTAARPGLPRCKQQQKQQ